MREHVTQNRRGRYSGPVLDGHFAGDWISDDVTDIMLQWGDRWNDSPRLGSLYSPPLPHISVAIRSTHYHFMVSYGAWVKIREF